MCTLLKKLLVISVLATFVAQTECTLETRKSTYMTSLNNFNEFIENSLINWQPPEEVDYDTVQDTKEDAISDLLDDIITMLNDHEARISALE